MAFGDSQGRKPIGLVMTANNETVTGAGCGLRIV